MTRRAWRRRDSFSASVKRKRIDLRDFFRAMPNVATGSREPASAFMKSILCEGTDRDEAVLPAAGKMLCISNAAITMFAAPAGGNLVAPARDARVVRTDEASGKR